MKLYDSSKWHFTLLLVWKNNCMPRILKSQLCLKYINVLILIVLKRKSFLKLTSSRFNHGAIKIQVQILRARFFAILTLLNWDNESVLVLNKKLKFPIHVQFFYLVPKHFGCPNWVKSIADDLVLSMPRVRFIRSANVILFS